MPARVTSIFGQRFSINRKVDLAGFVTGDLYEPPEYIFTINNVRYAV